MIRNFMKQGILPVACAALVTLVGCHSGQKYREYGDTGSRPVHEHTGPETPTPGATAEKPAEKPVAKPAAARPAATDLSMYYPTGDPNTSAVRIDKRVPREVSVGEEFSYDIIVTNISDLTLSNVVVTDRINDVMDVSRSNPAAASMRNGTGEWNLGEIEPGASRTITVTGKAATVGTITHCATIAFDSVICATINVVKPGLELVKTAPREVMLCDVIPVKLVVRNPGSGAARDVRINDPLPAGMVTQDGKNRIEIAVGTLAPGESKEYTVMCKAERTGSFENTATAAATGGLESKSGTTTTTVVQPQLTVECDAPEMRYIGRNTTFDVTVTNEGNGVANNVVLVDTLPAGVEIVNVSNNGQVSGTVARWNLGSMRPEESRKVSITIASRAPGKFRNMATVTGDCSSDARCSSEVEYQGIPAILLEVVDITDPVEVGTETTYVITATNQGSAPGTGIKINCTLPESQSFVSSGGATTGTNRGQSVSFAPLASLAPGQKATWTVVIRANREDDARFTVSMNSDQLTSSVDETEATNLYR